MERKKQSYNPYLPLDAYIPDGEPHVFGDRIYIFGSHDKEGGDNFCMLDYEGFSAPIDDLTDWRSEGIIYRADQDPDKNEKNQYLYAPDVVKGKDGRFYLYYAMSGGHFTGPIHVAVCDTPAGYYEYYGCVQNPDGSPFLRYITFDPGVINDNGVIRMYYGWAMGTAKVKKIPWFMSGIIKMGLRKMEMKMFNKTKEELKLESQGIQGANVVTLADDMLTVTDVPKRIVPGQFGAACTSFENHAFFEASSIRKIRDIYYFVYSSQVNHELCYATSKYPDKDFVFGGVIISNGDIGYQGREEKDRLCMSGNNHGSIECINGTWYIFYHRQTHKTSFSRQGCAEKIEILPDGSITQVEMTSCGLNGGPLAATGTYPAGIACNVTNGHMPTARLQGFQEAIPNITHNGDECFITEITDESMIGYKYFAFNGELELTMCIRGNANGEVVICTEKENLGSCKIQPSINWNNVSIRICANGTKALFIKYYGEGTFDLKSISFQ